MVRWEIESAPIILILYPQRCDRSSPLSHIAIALTYNERAKNGWQHMTATVIKPSDWIATGIRVETINNLKLFKFTEELGDRLQELLDQKSAIK
jgi:hypothetical protein